MNLETRIEHLGRDRCREYAIRCGYTENPPVWEIWRIVYMLELEDMRNG
jgi:hypothetical protein